MNNNWAMQSSRLMKYYQFKEWQKLVEERTGMLLPDHRKTFLQASLNIRMREIACESYDDYYKQLSEGVNGSVEWAVLVDRLTVHETQFFRHPESYTVLRAYLKRLMVTRAKQNKPINIWSVGCSTGEEPYSLAMLIEEIILEIRVEIYYGITATDISLPSLAIAREGVYSQKRLSEVTNLQRNLFFEKLDDESYRVKEYCKDKICFARVNLLELAQAPIDQVDVVFCQNVLIYFQKDRKNKIVSDLANSIEPGGLMLLGLGDLTDWYPESLRRVKSPKVLAFTKRIS